MICYHVVTTIIVALVRAHVSGAYLAPCPTHRRACCCWSQIAASSALPSDVVVLDKIASVINKFEDDAKDLAEATTVSAAVATEGPGSDNVPRVRELLDELPEDKALLLEDSVAQGVDAPDHIVHEASEGEFGSCAEVAAASMCAHELAEVSPAKNPTPPARHPR